MLAVDCVADTCNLQQQKNRKRAHKHSIRMTNTFQLTKREMSISVEMYMSYHPENLAFEKSISG